MKKIFTLLVTMLLLQGGVWLNGQVLSSDSLALVDIYNAAGGPGWVYTSNPWLTGNVSTWQGITVTGNRVTTLALDGITNIVGTISPSIGNLTALTTLQLNGNGDATPHVYIDLHDSIPVAIWNLTNLTRLQIKATHLTKWNPSGLYKLRNLVEFNTQATRINGSLPDSLFTLPNIAKLYLHESSFTGPVPATLTKATKLTRLYLFGGNKLTNLPYVNITNKSAAKIQFDGNFFTFAQIKPYADSSAKYLGYTNTYQLAKDTVFANIAIATGYAMKGTVANAEAYNWFKNGTVNADSINDSWIVKSALKTDSGQYVCKAQSSSVSGFDIRSIYNLNVQQNYSLATDSTALVDIYNAAGGPGWVYTSNPWLKGKVSTWQGITVTGNRVTTLALDGITNIVGTVSPSIGNLTGLTTLQLNGNGDATPHVYIDLHDSIPVAIWNLTNLTRLQIKATHLTKWNPSGIYKLRNLVEFNTQATRINGSLPDSLFTLPNIAKLYLHESSFTGAVPATLSKATKLTRLYLFGGNKLTGLPYVNITNKSAAKIQFDGNFFTFAQIKPYADSSAKYLGYTNTYQLAKDTVSATIYAGTKYAMHGTVTGAEAYNWFKNGTVNADSTNDSWIIGSASKTDSGQYVCKAQSSLVSNFDIRSVSNLNVKNYDLSSDSLALVDIYNAAGGSGWVYPSSSNHWLTGNVSTWQGITVTGNRVTTLALDGITSIVGTVSTSIGNLTGLTTLQLNGNGDATPHVYIDLHDSIPVAIWNLTNLTRLQIKATHLTKWNPAGIYKLRNLIEFNTQATRINGSLPDSLFTLPNISKLYLHESSFTGAVPATLTKATKLTRLYLFGGNKLTGLPYVNITKKSAAKIQFDGNFFTFAQMKRYADSSSKYLGYTNTYQFAQDTTTVNADERTSHKFSLKVTGAESYSWFKDTIASPVATDSTYTIASLALSDSGIYVCKAQSSVISGFDIRAAFVLKVKHFAAVVPTLASAATDATGVKINATFSKAMSNPSTFASDFTVKVNGTATTIKAISLDASDSKIVVIELNSVIHVGDVVLLSYAGTDVTSTDGGVLAAITDHAVTNNSTVTSIGNTEMMAYVYPNPCTDKLVIKSNSKFDARIFDITGKLVYELKNSVESTITVSMTNLPQGIYMLTLTSGNSYTTQKIIKK